MVTEAKAIMHNGPAIQPSWAILHARDRTPAPITPVIMCANAVHMVPNEKTNYSLIDYYKIIITVGMQIS